VILIILKGLIRHLLLYLHTLEAGFIIQSITILTIFSIFLFLFSFASYHFFSSFSFSQYFAIQFGYLFWIAYQLSFIIKFSPFVIFFLFETSQFLHH